VLAALAGALAALLVDAARRWYNRPVLEAAGCDYVDSEDGNERTWRLVVRNTGRTAARACVGQMTVHPLIRPGEPFIVKPFGVVSEAALFGGSSALDDLPMLWTSRRHQRETTLYPSLAQRLEVGRSQVHSPIEHANFAIPTEAGYDPPLITFAGPGYAFLVKVAAEGTGPLVVTGRVLWDARNTTMEYYAEVVEEFRTPVTPYLTGSRSRLPGSAQRWLRRREWSRQEARRAKTGGTS
jgi:hypothetical protein